MTIKCCILCIVIGIWCVGTGKGLRGLQYSGNKAARKKECCFLLQHINGEAWIMVFLKGIHTSQKGTLPPLPPSLALRNDNFTQDKLFIFDNHCLSLFGNFWPFWMGSSTFTSVLKPQNGSMYLYRVFSTPSLWGWKKEQKSQLLYLTYFHTPDDSTCIKNTIIIDTYNLKNVTILVILGYF